MTIPFNQVAAVNPGVISAGGSAVDTSALVLTKNILAPSGQILTFANANDVSNFFGATSIEAGIAAVYFQGYDGKTATPGAINFANYPESAEPAWAESGSLTGIALTQLQGFSGSFTVTVDGVVRTVASLSLAAATSFSGAATLLQTALNTSLPSGASPVTVVFSSIENTFMITSGTVGAASAIGYPSGTLAVDLLFPSANGGTLSQGVDATSPGAFMTNLVQSFQNFVSFMTAWLASPTEMRGFAGWVATQNARYGYVCWDNDPNALQPNQTSTFGNYLQTNNPDTVFLVWSPTYDKAAFACGFLASLDWQRLNGRATIFGKSQSGLTPDVTSQTAYNNLTANGYNSYGQYGSNNPANNQNFMNPGMVSGKFKWLDTWIDQVWLSANIQLANITTLRANGSLPYNAQGYNEVAAGMQDVIAAAVNFGAIRKGVVLSAAQSAVVQSMLGFDASATIAVQGYYLQIVAAPATTRGLRQSPSITLLYQDGESIQQINVASDVIQ